MKIEKAGEIVLDIDYQSLNEICSNIDLLSYASQTMNFHERGSKYFTSCPLHSDSDPSLCISPDKNLWYCFSCHKGGNIINWMMVYEKLTFEEALNRVSQLAGIEVSSLQICNSLKYFKELERLAERHISKPIERQILDYKYYETQFVKEIPQEWVDEGISPEIMEYYDIRIDKKSNRICYLVYDNDDNLIGVKGRTRFANFKELRIKKYNNYNSIVTTNFFVGMHENREFIKSASAAYIFEGIKSGLKLSTWGCGNNWLAAETSRLNEAQIEILLDMHLKEVNIAFDRDVDRRDIIENCSMLSRFCNVFMIRDRYNRNRLLPGDKDSPVDAGEDVWKTLENEKVRL